jgi:ribosome maturation factor RimP
VGIAHFFCFWAMEIDRRLSRLWELATQVAAGEGMEVVEIEFRHEGSRGGRVLRLYLDKEGGPSIDDLGRLSRQFSDVLDNHDDIVEGAYTLEVSSPGINRPLKKPEHFERFVGKRVRVRTRDMIDGRRTFLGILAEVRNEKITVNVEGKDYQIPFSMIEKSNYEHDWSA